MTDIKQFKHCENLSPLHTFVRGTPKEKAGEEAIARFEREVRHTSQLQHPNTVSIYDYGVLQRDSSTTRWSTWTGWTLISLSDRTAC